MKPIEIDSQKRNVLGMTQISNAPGSVLIAILMTQRVIRTMANSKFDYVRSFERDPVLLRQCWVVLRLDGRGFTRFCDVHNFAKPNDDRGLGLMNAAAAAVLEDFREVQIAFGQSDEFSFVFHKDMELFSRRSFKIVSIVSSVFTGNYVKLWNSYFPDLELKLSPSFDGRIVEYPTVRHVRDYLSWRQVDTHINNQYNTCFWELVKSGMHRKDAQKYLEGTNKETKNELLFERFGINYNDLPEQYRKGSVLFWEVEEDGHHKKKKTIKVEHVDIIKDEFWTKHSSLLSD